mgnify:CR=1 FL=1
MNFFEIIGDFFSKSGIAQLFSGGEIIMIAISCGLLYLAIAKGFEPLLLIPIAFGMLLANLPLSGVMHPEFFADGLLDIDGILHGGGILDLLYLGVKLGIYPPLIFLGIGAMTDFSPLIANPNDPAEVGSRKLTATSSAGSRSFNVT